MSSLEDLLLSFYNGAVDMQIWAPLTENALRNIKSFCNETSCYYRHLSQNEF